MTSDWCTLRPEGKRAPNRAHTFGVGGVCTLRFTGRQVSVHAWCTLVHAVHAFMGLELLRGLRGSVAIKCKWNCLTERGLRCSS